MNRTNGHLLWYLLILACCTGLFGCSPANTTLVRFQGVPIPMYDTHNYEALLTSDDPEIRYNAISNLIPQAVVYARLIAIDETHDTTEAPRSANAASASAQAQYVFTTIRDELQQDDDNIKAASLMFLAEFAPFYAEKKASFATVSQVNSRDVRTQYEQLNTLLALIESDTAVDRTMISRFLNSRTWRIRSMTYRLLGHIACDDLHPQLLRAYRKTTREVDKLVMLQAFTHQYGANVFDLLQEELLVSEYPQIQRFIAEMLPTYHDAMAVSHWIVAEYHNLHDDIVLRIFDRYAEELSASHGVPFFEGLLVAASPDLKQLLGQSRVVELLYHAIEHDPSRSDLIRLRERLQEDTYLQQSWNAYARERAQAEAASRAKDALRRAILPHYTELLNTFLEDTRRLLADFGMEANEIENATEDMRALLHLFQDTSEE